MVDDGRREPEPVSLEGTQPLHDADIDSLANERTMLAWLRTGFALVATGGLVLHASRDEVVLREVIVGLSTIALGVAVWALGYTRFRIGEDAIERGDPMLPLAIIRTLAITVNVAAVGTFVIALLATG